MSGSLESLLHSVLLEDITSMHCSMSVQFFPWWMMKRVKGALELVVVEMLILRHSKEGKDVGCYCSHRKRICTYRLRHSSSDPSGLV